MDDDHKGLKITCPICGRTLLSAKVIIDGKIKCSKCGKDLFCSISEGAVNVSVKQIKTA